VAKHTASGKPVCANCNIKARKADLSKHERCRKCREIKPVAVRSASGKPCPNCYRIARYRDRSWYEKCRKCGKLRPVETRSSLGKPLCPVCYKKTRKLPQPRFSPSMLRTFS
jgi:hypothetical protein